MPAMIMLSILLGLIQGITEFLPVSSSGHLLIAHQFFGRTENTLALDATLHLATALALLIYFRRDWLAMLPRRNPPPGSGTRDEKNRASHKTSPGALKSLAVATLPAALAGFFLRDIIETRLRSPSIVVATLAAVAFPMFFIERKNPRLKTPPSLAQNLVFQKALFIGCMQAIALVPGVSRSGITIIAGMLVGFSRSQSARFAFLLGAPITLGAGLLQLFQIASQPAFSNTSLLAISLSFLTAFISGLISVHWLLKFVRSHSLRIFAVYRLLLALLVSVLLLSV